MAELNKAKYFEGIGHVPHSKGQQAFHDSTARFRVAACGRRYGKSTMASRDLEPRLFIPNRRYWLVGPTYDLGEKEFRVLWNDIIIKLQFGRHKKVRKAYNKRSGEMYIELPNQSRVEVRSAQHPETLVGDNLDHVIMCEAAKHKEDTFERYIRPALADRLGGADFPSTPEGLNWFHDRYEYGQDGDHPDWASFHFPSWENPIVYPGGRQDPEILAIERTTSKEFFDQEIGADFTTFVGRIYTEFDRDIHVLKQPYRFHPEWPNYIAFDWGYINPLAAVEFQVSPSDEVFIWREHYQAYLTVAEHCQILNARDQPYGYHLDLGFGDAADPEAAAVVSQHLVRCYTDPMAKANWREGIDLVTSLMKSEPTGKELDEYGTPEMKPHFWIDRSCRHTIKEHMNYRRKDNATSATSEAGKLAPTNKQEDHTCDAVRYGVMHIFVLGAQQHLADVEEAADIPTTWRSAEPRMESVSTFTVEDMYEGLGVISGGTEHRTSTYFDLTESDF